MLDHVVIYGLCFAVGWGAGYSMFRQRKGRQSMAPLLESSSVSYIAGGQAANGHMSHEWNVDHHHTAVILHGDGTVSYWSVARQQWVREVRAVPSQDYAAMASADRHRVRAHLSARPACTIQKPSPPSVLLFG
jgi:hypothetical protein